MDIELRISHSYYDIYYHPETILAWQTVWDTLFRMAYFREGVVNKIITLPTRSDDLDFYNKASTKNHHEITLDYCWREFCKTHKDTLYVVPELKEIYVPEYLFSCLGVWSLFKHSFPNCKVTFWS